MLLFTVFSIFQVASAQDLSNSPNGSVVGRPYIEQTCVKAHITGHMSPEGMALIEAQCIEAAKVVNDGYEAQTSRLIGQTEAETKRLLALEQTRMGTFDYLTRKSAVDGAVALGQKQSFDMSSLTVDQITAMDLEKLAMIEEINKAAKPSLVIDGPLVATGRPAEVIGAWRGNGLSSQSGLSTVIGLQSQQQARLGFASQVMGGGILQPTATSSSGTSPVDIIRAKGAVAEEFVKAKNDLDTQSSLAASRLAELTTLKTEAAKPAPPQATDQTKTIADLQADLEWRSSWAYWFLSLLPGY